MCEIVCPTYVWTKVTKKSRLKIVSCLPLESILALEELRNVFREHLSNKGI